ncbi:glycosyl transferase family 64 protein [Nitzschia inconspicua]|uniref:Glycosyl transferase family 64 protein n=1 Tax=Nitzschia inconspicua TaxID=303405 RepID=A0A9K3LUN4_9STRA|nr:glycosyl transferase family 64 protein [Nitzschia inconspicua]
MNTHNFHHRSMISATNGLGHDRAGGKTTRIMTRRAMVGFGCFALAFLVAVHLYLFLTVIQRNGTTTTTTSSIIHSFSNSTTTHKSLPNPLIRGSKKEQKIQSINEFELTPLRPIDREFYTIRINTWRRPKQLVASVLHHASCPGTHKVQVVWCDHENEPPAELLDPIINPHASKVVIEYHEANSLNERFRVLDDPETLGILSIDDDVLRPCEAIDSGFFKWVHSPHRMVGFDARAHVENADGRWSYGYLSTTRKENRYSMSLTRYCFLHRDYLDYYLEHLPTIILEMVAQNFNCEDIAMSFMISSLTQGQPSLLADTWAMNTQMKLRVEDKISGGKDHKKLRDECVDSFAQMMGIKDGTSSIRLQKAKILRSKTLYFESGAKTDDKMNDNYPKSQREIQHEEMIRKWKSNGPGTIKTALGTMMRMTGKGAYEMGLLGSAEDEKKKEQQQQE